MYLIVRKNLKCCIKKFKICVQKIFEVKIVGNVIKRLYKLIRKKEEYFNRKNE